MIDYLGVKYHCGGAVCGNWWKGDLDEFAPAYSILDLYEDGSSHIKPYFMIGKANSRKQTYAQGLMP